MLPEPRVQCRSRCRAKTESALPSSWRDSFAHVDWIFICFVTVQLSQRTIQWEVSEVVDCVDSCSDEALLQWEWSYRTLEQSACDTLAEVTFVERIEWSLTHLAEDYSMWSQNGRGRTKPISHQKFGCRRQLSSFFARRGC